MHEKAHFVPPGQKRVIEQEKVLLKVLSSSVCFNLQLTYLLLMYSFKSDSSKAHTTHGLVRHLVQVLVVLGCPDALVFGFINRFCLRQCV
jgi:Na+-transporting NADH:ubiquinone oxidoreductase subunit NqrE